MCILQYINSLSGHRRTCVTGQVNTGTNVRMRFPHLSFCPEYSKLDLVRGHRRPLQGHPQGNSHRFPASKVHFAANTAANDLRRPKRLRFLG